MGILMAGKKLMEHLLNLRRCPRCSRDTGAGMIRRYITVEQAITRASSTQQGDIWNMNYDQDLSKG
jgi:hypothetical protein